MIAAERRIPLPRPPESPPASRFPLFATIAPIGGSLALFALTRSPFALAFAALGPLVAGGSLADGRLSARRAKKREAARFAAELRVARSAIDEAHAAELAELRQRFPTALERAAGALRWPPHPELAVRIGTGTTRSSLDLGTEDARMRDLIELAAKLEGAPIVADLSDGIAIHGVPALASAVLRAVCLQLAALLPPGEWERLDEPESTTFSGPDGRKLRVVCGREESTSGVVLRIEPDGLATLTGGPGAAVSRLRPDLVSAEEAAFAAEVLEADDSGTRLPDVVELADLLDGVIDSATDGPRIGLAAPVGAGRGGPVVLDLVTDGPHSIVAGTTGSGKSELLLSWVLAMATGRSTTEVSFLFVDFKGGASFAALETLPHSVGVITDLDDREAVRALASLGAELRFRERRLAEAGLRSIDDAVGTPPFPRLVVVVDEYAALVDTSPALNAVFLDAAARGRSLGVHLVLCTQRPAGVVRDGILANTGLRIALRTTSSADSRAVLDSDGAAALPAANRGRAILRIAGGDPLTFQVARSNARDVARVVEAGNGPPPRRPWCAPLAERIPLESVSFGRDRDDIPFAAVDLPEQQRQEVARYRPVEHGSLLIVGGAASGRSTALASLQAAPTLLARERVPSGLPSLWDALGRAIREVEAGAGSSRVLLIDDLDSVLAATGEDYAAALVERLARVLRDGPSRGIWAVLTVQRIPAVLHSALALCGSRLLLRMPDRQEHALAGGESSTFAPHLPPGAGLWRGHRVQVFFAEGVAQASDPEVDELDVSIGPLAVVSTRPETFGRALAVLGHPVEMLEVGTVLPTATATATVLGDPDSWQANWSSGAVLRSRNILFDGCSTAEIRALTRRRDPPPPFAAGERGLWLLADGEFRRVRLPAANQASTSESAR